MIVELGTVATGSFLASAHCVGMCGGLAAAVGATRPRFWPTLGRQLIYTAGRVFTYSFLGAIGGMAGQSLARYDSALVSSQQVFSMLAGVIMVLVGLSSLGWMPARRIAGVGQIAHAFSGLFRHFLNMPGRFGYFLAGLATGFLPCGLVYAFLSLAVARGNAIEGLIWMAAFGIGTAPAMIAVGCGAAVIGRNARIGMLRAAACAMIVMGGVSVYRAVPRDKPCCSERHIGFISGLALPSAV